MVNEQVKSSKMRKVMCSTLIWENGMGRPEEKGEAIFHQFGVNYEEFDGGPGNYTTAIVEWPDGTIQGIPIELVRFLDSPN